MQRKSQRAKSEQLKPSNTLLKATAPVALKSLALEPLTKQKKKAQLLKRKLVVAKKCIMNR
jgi:hypothetical protein